MQSIRDLFGSSWRGEDENAIWEAARNLISNSINWLLIIAGFAAVILVVWGGYTMIMSGGDSAKVEQGKKTILWAIIGLILVALASLIIHLTIGLIQPSVPIPNN